ncbi:hypothetical protein CERSUDRAFT_118189 [Gelatoporia subvermispora B]|uniref:SAP domain-containing protein n=1 Tax=Ceriporiopsis subvermispora (strain B) TaxID=914234 RepID=M2QLU5_CERS8|nr:hypothetical protein CERSUDRAFT_118189 [Gelatoporia subvermispora B]
MSTSVPMDFEALRILGRPRLQKLAKSEGLKANGKNEAIIERLLEKYPGGVPRDRVVPMEVKRERSVSPRVLRRSQRTRVKQEDVGENSLNVPKAETSKTPAEVEQKITKARMPLPRRTTVAQPTTTLSIPSAGTDTNVPRKKRTPPPLPRGLFKGTQNEAKAPLPLPRRIPAPGAPAVIQAENARLMQISNILSRGIKGFSPVQPVPLAMSQGTQSLEDDRREAVGNVEDSVRDEFVQGSSRLRSPSPITSPQPELSFASFAAEPTTSPTAARHQDADEVLAEVPPVEQPIIRGASHKDTRKVLRDMARMLDFIPTLDQEVEEQTILLKAAQDHIKEGFKELDQNQCVRLGVEELYFKRFKHDQSLKDGSWFPPHLTALRERVMSSLQNQSSSSRDEPAVAGSSSQGQKRKRDRDDDSSEEQPDKEKKRAKS